MNTLILIVQTFFGASAYEFGPYPDAASCEKHAKKHIQDIEASGQVIKIERECRLIYPELNQANSVDNTDPTYPVLALER